MRIMSMLLDAMLVGAAGCEPMDAQKSREMNEFLTDSYEDQQVNNAILAQHTLYPYHFQANCQDLNDLGMHDLCVLASHYCKNPGKLNIRRGNATDALYRARVEAVDAALAKAGVPTDRIQITDGTPGGDGMASEHVIVILRETYQRQAPGAAVITGDQGYVTNGIITTPVINQ